MGKKLFVGGLSWDTTDESLQKAFEPYGEISEAKVITDRDTGRSRGFGFVTFAQDEDAKTAISKMHGTSLDGRNITVNEAQERSPREGGRGGRNR
jgi:RNA recognition motif-containing protein